MVIQCLPDYAVCETLYTSF